MEMTSSINRFINFGKAIEFGKLELENKNILEQDSEKTESIPFRYTIIIFVIKLLLSIKSVRESYEIWYIDLLERYLISLKGYGEILKSLSQETIQGEYLLFQNFLPVYQKLDNLFQSLKPESKNEETIYFLFHEVTEEIIKIEATLDIFTDPEMVKDLIQTKEITKKENLSELVKWDQALIK